MSFQNEENVVNQYARAYTTQKQNPYAPPYDTYGRNHPQFLVDATSPKKRKRDDTSVSTRQLPISTYSRPLQYANSCSPLVSDPRIGASVVNQTNFGNVPTEISPSTGQPYSTMTFVPEGRYSDVQNNYQRSSGSIIDTERNYIDTQHSGIYRQPRSSIQSEQNYTPVQEYYSSPRNVDFAYPPLIEQSYTQQSYTQVPTLVYGDTLGSSIHDEFYRRYRSYSSAERPDFGSRLPRDDISKGHWTQLEICTLLHLVKGLIQHDLKTISLAARECRIYRTQRAFDKKLKRLVDYKVWRLRDNKEIIKRIDEALSEGSYSTLPKDMEELVTRAIAKYDKGFASSRETLSQEQDHQE